MFGKLKNNKVLYVLCERTELKSKDPANLNLFKVNKTPEKKYGIVFYFIYMKKKNYSKNRKALRA